MFFYPSCKSKTLLKMVMTRSVFESIRRELGRRVPEAGGMLGTADGERITDFHFDHSARTSGGTYSPDSILLNRLLDHEWNPADIRLVGFVHSHPAGFGRPSAGDEAYAARILECNPHLDRLFLPIVQTEDSGRFEILPFIATRNGTKARTERAELIVVDDVTVNRPELISAMPKSQPAAASIAASSLPGSCVTFGTDGVSLAETFRRVTTAYDLGRMSTSRMFVAGAGGSASFVEDMVRAGLGEVVIVDPDVVAETNLATQHYRRADIGHPKVACLAERLRDINPHAAVIAQQRRLEDIDDQEFEKLAFAPLRAWTVPATDMWGIPGLSVPVHVEIRPAVTLLCGLTDNFFCQSRINRLGLHFALPTLCAQVYEQGSAAEITFTHAETTPACHRCILSSRFEAYLEKKFENTVTADGCPLYATTRLNSLKTALALALLHHGSNHPRWAPLLQRIGNRNLVQIRMDPDVSLPVFDRVFGGADQARVVFDEAAWLPQEAECPANGGVTCPDCGGLGDLRAAKGSFDDTRIMRTLKR